jgi:hypothetical protein
MPLLVHITPDNKANALRRNGLSPTRLRLDPERHPEFDRVVWAFAVLPSYMSTHSWSRELKRSGATTLAAVTFLVPDREPVFARHFSETARLMSAVEAVGLIAAMDDPRGLEIMVTRRIAPREIERMRTLPKAIGWRYMRGAKGRSMSTCDCPVCKPRGEVKAKRYRERVYRRMDALGLRDQLGSHSLSPREREKSECFHFSQQAV